MNVREHPASQAPGRAGVRVRVATLLPTWPIGVMFAGLPLWWASGLLDVVTIPFALLMAWLLTRAHGVRVPRGFGWWLLYCAWALASVVMLDRAVGVVLFGYRWLLCVAAGVIFAYVFNARATLTSRYLSGTLTLWFLYVALGGCLGLLAPTGSLRTPLHHLLPAAARGNELVGQMTIRPFAQYNPGGFLEVSPRPTAPFLYTNNWGSVYSLLAPFVVVYLLHTWRTRRGAAVAVLLVASTIPAFLTLNRGMFVSLGIAVAYLVGRAVLARNLRIVAVVALAATLGVVLFNLLPISERLGMRLNEDAQGTSNTTRISLYEQSLSAVASSPLLGHATPIPPANPLEPSVGTQGQLWMLLVSHGPVAAFAWITFFLAMYARGRRRGDPIGVAACTTLLVGTVQLLFYGMLPYGLPLLMIAAAVAARGPELPTTEGDLP
ncbi:O-antigen ligase family protein [Nocardioides sp. SLBN-35]|uniref:O-antigen ligase family protein n=1 Tax=Nocardioides sp. SLBN-35 TaxID=2768445 RepID=UPI0011535C8C|nr:O-antigen ligase family protein [Nocardioides sp. SLBN-35]TQK71266.1 O-antigen ligase [Nocardioides sp. SLBN-35]